MRGLALIAVAAAACAPGFQSPSEVTDLRILAVSAEPPEAFVDLDGGTVTPVTVTLLVADPAQRRTPQITGGGICLPTDTDLCDPAQTLSLPKFAPGVMQFTLQPPAQAVVAALQNDKLKGLGGVRVQLNATVADDDPHGPVTAAKVLLYSTVAPERANHSPRIASLQITRAGGGTESIQPGGAIGMRLGEQIGLRPLHGDGPDGAETYTTTDLSGNQVTLTEQLNYSFFGSLGVSWDQDTAGEPLPNTPAPTFGIVRLTAEGRGSWPIWVVVRDGRGGVSWVTASVEAQ